MLSFTVILQELSTTMLAAGTGLVFYKRLNLFSRILLLQVLVYLSLDITALIVKEYNADGNNNWIYNLQLPLETGLLLLAAGVYFGASRAKLYILMAYAFFLVVFLMDILLNKGFFNFTFNGAITEGLVVSGVYLVVLYDSFMQKKPAYAVAATGLVLYFMATLPELSASEYLMEHDPTVADMVFQYIVVIAAIIRYFFLALAFFLQVYGRRSDQNMKGMVS